MTPIIAPFVMAAIRTPLLDVCGCGAAARGDWTQIVLLLASGARFRWAAAI